MFTDLTECKIRAVGDAATGPDLKLTLIRLDMASLQKLLELQPSTIYPGHGPHTNGRAPAIAKIEEYITHRLDRETQIVHALEKLTSEAESSKTGITTRQIVEVIYAGLGIGVYMAADKPVTAHLVKLERDGRVSRDSIGNWRLLQSSGQ